MKDPKHIMTRRGCRRCALGARENGGYCLPGYWMTKAEIARWDAAVGPVDQQLLDAKRKEAGPGDDPKPAGETP